jgi:hypothetical protein
MNDMNDDLDFEIDEKLQALANVVAELMDLGVSEYEIKRQVDGVFEVYDPEGRRG